jgi:hypothetical protein
VGTPRGGVAASPAETEALLTTLTGHVVEVTQTRLTNVYDSVEAYNATTGATVPYHVLVLAGFPAGIGDRAAELLGRLARNGPRSGLYIVATIDPDLDLPRGFDLAGLGELGTTLSLDERGDLGSCWRTRSWSFSRCRRSRASRSSSRRCAARRCSHAARLPLRAMSPLVCVRTATGRP